MTQPCPTSRGEGLRRKEGNCSRLAAYRQPPRRCCRPKTHLPLDGARPFTLLNTGKSKVQCETTAARGAVNGDSAGTRRYVWGNMRAGVQRGAPRGGKGCLKGMQFRASASFLPAKRVRHDGQKGRQKGSKGRGNREANSF
jgi:hypothetical protein